MRETVLITGISGWIAQFCALELLKNGYKVKGSLRDLERREEVTKALKDYIKDKDQLIFCQLDLLKDQGWDEACKGCKYVLHVASPFTVEEPKNEDELILPAKEGTLRALESAKKAGVKRIIITSSIAAMYAHMKNGVFSEKSWTDLNSTSISTYQKSKTIAEQLAWDFYRNQKGPGKIEMSVINPGAVLGPALSPDLDGASLSMCVKMLEGKMPGIPNINLTMVDVRDVAKHHLQAMTNPFADGKRFISAQSKAVPFSKVAKILKNSGHKKVILRKVPSYLINILSFFSKEARGLKSVIDKHVDCDNSQTVEIFKWKPIKLEKTVIEMGESVQSFLRKKNNSNSK